MAQTQVNLGLMKPEIRLAQAISQFEAVLSDQEKTTFRNLKSQFIVSPPDSNDVLRLTAEMDREVSRATGRRCFGPRFTNFLQGVQQYAALGDVIVGASQQLSACAVWSLVRMSLLSIVSYSAFYEKVSHLFMELGRSAPRPPTMALPYIQSKDLQSQLCEYFIVVVHLCRHMMSAHKSTLRIFTSNLNDQHFKSFQSELDRWAHSIQGKVQLIEAQEHRGSDFSSFSKSFDRISTPNNRKQVLDFCSKYDHVTTWKQTRKLGDAAYLAQFPFYQEWKIQPVSSVFICTGKPGSGKSVLMANIVSDLHKSTKISGTIVTYFFCRHDIPESLKARTILGSLVRQLLQTAPDLSMLVERCDTADAASVENLIDLVHHSLVPGQKAYFVLDGIDECDLSNRKALAQGLRGIGKTVNLLLCISSRKKVVDTKTVPEGGLESFISPSSGLWAASIPDDIPGAEAFIQMELERCITNQKLTIGDPSLILDIQDALLKNSQGRLNWITSQIQSLCTMRSDHEIRAKLADFPIANVESEVERADNTYAQSEKRRAEEREEIRRYRQEEDKERAKKEAAREARRKAERVKEEIERKEREIRKAERAAGIPTRTSSKRHSRRQSMSQEQIAERDRALAETHAQMARERAATEQREREEQAALLVEQLKTTEYYNRRSPPPPAYTIVNDGPGVGRRNSSSRRNNITSDDGPPIAFGQNRLRRVSIVPDTPPVVPLINTSFPQKHGSPPSNSYPSSSAIVGAWARTPRKNKESISSFQRHIPGSFDNSSTNSLPHLSVFDEESQHHGAFSSTIPTSLGTSKAEAEDETAKLGNIHAQDSGTIYSIDSAGEDLEYALLFAHRLTQDLKTESGLPDLSTIPQTFVSDVVGAFTWRLYEESKNPFQWETSVILHRQKNKIVRVLIGGELDQGTSDVEEDSDGESRQPFVKSLDYLSKWVNDISACNDDESPKSPEDQDIGESQLFQIADYEKFIHQSDAYRWLLSKISQYNRLLFEPSDAMVRIGEHMRGKLQTQESLRTMSRCRPLSLVKMTFNLEWNPKAYIKGLGIQDSSPNILDRVLCLTGKWSEAQAMTVSEYIHQTWPVTGDAIKTLFQELLTRPEGQESICPVPGVKDAHMTACLASKIHCIVSVTAGTYFISEFTEQIAWLASTLRSSPRDEGVADCHPRIENLSVRNVFHEDTTVTTTGTCSFSFNYEYQVLRDHNESGFCWGSLFRNATLVSGFPILLRPEARTGLEMSLGTMASLVQSDQLVQCGERIILKGFGLLLIATLATSNVIMWHLFTSNGPGERISYFDSRLDSLDLRNCNIPSLRPLESSRHIVGWCANATDFCGHMTANFAISESRLRPSPSSFVIDRMYIEGGMHIIGGVNFRPNQKEQPIKLQRERDYPELLQMVAAHPVAFYDVADRRAWLVDGASALLYLVRISLHLDATDPESAYDWVFDSTKLQDTWGGCSGRIAALKTLKSWDHRNLHVYVKGQSTHDGQVIRTFSTFGDRVDKVLHWLEILIDRDVYLASQDGIKMSQTLDRRKNISGFDLLDLIKPLGPIGTRVAPFDSWGDGWIDLFPSIGVTTIFGNGFGDLVRPDDPAQVCVDWKSVPVGQDYMTATVSTLKMIHEKRLRRLTPVLGSGELTSNILWTSPCHPFKSCNCLGGELTGKEKHLDPVQFLVSKKSWNPSRKPKATGLVDMQTLGETGAVVFANLSLLGRRIDAKADHGTMERVNDEASLSVPSNSSQASSQSATTLSITGSANVTNITTPSDGSVENGSQQNDNGLRTGKSRVEKLQRKLDWLKKK